MFMIKIEIVSEKIFEGGCYKVFNGLLNIVEMFGEFFVDMFVKIW